MGLVGMRSAVDHQRCALPHFVQKGADQHLDRPSIDIVGTEVPGLGKFRTVLEQPLREEQVPGKRLQDVLPRADRMRVPDPHRLALQYCRIQSGMMRSAAQSPPPMTFPARAEAIPTLSRHGRGD